MIVVDTNVVAYLLLPGPLTEAAEALLIDRPEWAAPPLWRSEWRNVLIGALRRGQLGLDQVLALQQQAEDLVIGHEEVVRADAVLQLAAASGCSAYDCEFVAAAQQLGVPLITADRALLRAFPDLAQPLPHGTPEPGVKALQNRRLDSHATKTGAAMTAEATRDSGSQGMRPIEIWVQDVHAPGFEAEARRQSRLAAQSPEEAEIQALIDSVYEWPDDGYSQ